MLDTPVVLSRRLDTIVVSSRSVEQVSSTSKSSVEQVSSMLARHNYCITDSCSTHPVGRAPPRDIEMNLYKILDFVRGQKHKTQRGGIFGIIMDFEKPF